MTEGILMLFSVTNVDWTATGTMFIALGTFVLAGIAWTQLGKTNKISKADFAHRFKSDFFNERTRQLFLLFEYDLLLFKKERVANARSEFMYFEVDREKIDSAPFLRDAVKGEKKLYTCHEIDDLLLGHFEDLGLFCKKGLMEIEFIYEGFDFYIEEIHENEQIKKYIADTRKEEGGEDIYDNFDYIFDEVRRYGKCKELSAH